MALVIVFFPILRAAQTGLHNFMQWDQLFAGKVANFIFKLISKPAPHSSNAK